MTGFNIKDGVAYKVELPDTENASVTTEACDSAYNDVSSMKCMMDNSKEVLSHMLVGIGNEVTQAYAKIHAKKDPYAAPEHTATVYDMHEMTEKYEDYYRAMTEYVKLICDIKGNEVDPAKAMEKVNRALSNDPGFIHSIVDTDKMDLERCMRQIECVVEIIHDIDVRSNQISQIFANAPQNELRTMAERLICNSVCRFTDDMVKYAKSNIESLKTILRGPVTQRPTAQGTPANAYVML